MLPRSWMRNSACSTLIAMCLTLFLGVAGPAAAKEVPRKKPTARERAEMRRIREQLAAQQSRIDQQEDQLDEQRARLERQEQLIQTLLSRSASDAQLEERVGRGAEGATAPAPAAEPEAARMISPESPMPEKQVGQAPERRAMPEVASLADVGGVLTPRGTFVLEPSQQFGSTGVNRFTFAGFGPVPAILIGNVEASDADRDVAVSALGARYGVTNRFEVDARIPFVMRSDRLSRRIVTQDGQPILQNDVKGAGFGDIEFGMHYQLNRGESGWPFLIGNLRVKSNTGSNPFSVSRDELGFEKTLPTGSGFWSVEPSLTAVYQSDPALFFGNLSYGWNVKSSVSENFQTPTGIARIGEVDPGDALGVNFGMSLALNERASFTLGYDHKYIRKSDTEVNGRIFTTESLQLGQLLFGLSLSGRKTQAVSLVLGIGVTEDAPDVQLTLRAPLKWDLFARKKRSDIVAR